MSYYPSDVGIKLTKQSFDEVKIEHLKKTLPKNLIIRVYGMAGVGKGTLSGSLASVLGIPNLDSGKIWRALTYIYKKLELKDTPENTDKVFSELKVEDTGHLVNLFHNDKLLEHDNLKNEFIDSRVFLYASKEANQQKFFKFNSNIYQNIMKTAFVLDGRGANPPDVKLAEEGGMQVIRILLDANEEVIIQRYIDNHIKINRASDPDFVLTDEASEKLKQEVKTTIIARNKRDVETQQKLGNGLVSKDSGIIDSSYMSPQEVLETALSFINSRLG